MNSAPRIPVVEDDPRIALALESGLDRAGYSVKGADSVAGAIQAASLQAPDVVLLDMMLPDGSGLDVCRSLREWSRAPMIVVSAHDDEQKKVEALDAGADEYVVKPYGTPELLARIRAAERRAAAPGGQRESVHFGEIEVTLYRRQVRRGGADVHLTPREWGLLAEPCRAPGRVVTHVRASHRSVGAGLRARDPLAAQAREDALQPASHPHRGRCGLPPPDRVGRSHPS